MAKIEVIITGGTIDSIWSGAKDTVVVSGNSVLPEYFAELSKNLVLYDELHFNEACMKDSRQITDDDRNRMLQLIKSTDAKKILITHGTYTMPDTARFLEKSLKRNDQTIIITGSMVPIKGFDFSDGPFNLGYAFAQLQLLPPGIYICMNGRAFKPAEVSKNVSEGRFYSTFQDKQ